MPGAGLGRLDYGGDQLLLLALGLLLLDRGLGFRLGGVAGGLGDAQGLLLGGRGDGQGLVSLGLFGIGRRLEGGPLDIAVLLGLGHGHGVGRLYDGRFPLGGARLAGPIATWPGPP